jgi:hypothetical protein
VKAYFPHVAVSNKNLKRKKEVRPGERVTENKSIAMHELVRMRTERQHVGVLLVVDLPHERARRHDGDWLRMQRFPLRVIYRYIPTAQDYKIAAVELLMTTGERTATDIRTGDIKRSPPPEGHTLDTTGVLNRSKHEVRRVLTDFTHRGHRGTHVDGYQDVRSEALRRRGHR